MRIKISCIVLLLISSFSAWSQNPGGVSGDLRLWYKAGVGVTSTVDGAATFTWQDQSPIGTNASVSGNLFYRNNATDNLNFNPTIDFDNNSYFQLNRIGIRSSNHQFGNPIYNYTIIGIGIREDGDYNVVFGDQNNDGADNTLGFGYFNNNTSAGITHLNTNLVVNGLNTFNGNGLSPFLLMGSYDQNSGRLIEEYRDGGHNQNTDNVTTPLNGFSGHRIGSLNVPGINNYNGRISEVIAYRKILTQLEKLQVYTYLALKYGIALTDDLNDNGTGNEVVSGAVREGDYVASDGITRLWNYNLQGATYSNTVVGIGRDDNSGLNQKQSKYASADGLVTMALGAIATTNTANTNTFSTDKSFLLWGNNAGTNTFTTTGAPTNRQILGRVWRIAETGTVGTVKLQIPASTSSLTTKLPFAGTLDLLVDDDGDFSSGATIYKMTLVGTNWEVDVNFDNSDFFTFSPGGVEINTTTNGSEAGPINIVFTITLPSVNTTGSAITFDLNDAGTGSAISGTDYNAIPNNAPISIANNAQSTSYNVTVLNDAIAEGLKSLNVTLSNSSNPTFFISKSSATATIADDDGGPGGVRTNLNVWLKADIGAGTTNNTNVTSWVDQSFNGNNGTQDGNPPSFRNNAVDNMNYNPVVLFDGSNDRLVIDLEDIKNGNGAGNGRYAIFGVGKRTDIGTNLVIGSPDFNFNQKVHFGYQNNGTVNFENNASLSFNTNNFDNPAISPFLLYTASSNSGRTLEEQRDGIFRRGTNTYTGKIQTGSSNFIGALPQATAYFQGPMSEIIVFENVISNLQKHQIYSYLSLKYGLQLTNNSNANGTVNEVISGSVREGDYVASDGTTIFWTYATNTLTYFNDVAGIGRDDNASLSQLQSKSSSSDALVTMAVGSVALTNSANTGSFNADKQFLMWGNNNGANTFTTTGAPANTTILTRKWRVQETGALGNVTVSVPDNSSTLSSKLPYSGTLSLFQSNTTNFSSGATITTMTLNGTNWEASIDFTNGQYFTFGVPPTPANLSVTTQGSENGPTAIVYTVTLDAPNTTGSAITFDFDDLGTGTATSGSDYTAVAGNAIISIANNASIGSISIPVIDDANQEPTETIIAQISNASSTSVGIVSSTATATIQDNDIGPGGINNDLEVWLRADKSTSTTVNNTALNTWTDVSGSGNNAMQDGNPPAYLNNTLNNFNFNPTVDFDGTDDRLVVNLSSIKNSNYTLFAVGERDNASFNVVIGSEGGTTNQDLHFGYRNGNTATLAHWGNDMNTNVPPANDPAGITPFILMGRQSTNERILEEVRDQVYSVNTDNNSTLLSGTKTNYIGTLSNFGYFNGRISEVIVFSDFLGVLDRQRVYTYLALKYGIRLMNDNNGNGTVGESLNGGTIFEGDYIASNNAKVWDYTARGLAYFNNVAGIGRDDEAGLYQKQTKSVHTNSLLTIGLGSITSTNKNNPNLFNSDVSYMLWGHNNGALTLTTTGAPTATQMLSRNWQIEETGVVGTVKIRVPASTSSNATKLPASASYSILVDADGDFTTGSVATNMTLVGTNWEVDIDLNDGDYITFGIPTISADLSVTTNGNEAGPVNIVLAVTLSMTNTSGSPITFDIDDLGTGTATPASDYTTIAGNAKISVANGASSGTFTVTVLNDALAEGPEIIDFLLSNPSLASVTINQDSATAYITDDDASPSPGGVFSNLIFWYKGNVGVTPGTNGTSVTQWTDQSPGVRNATNFGTGPTFISVFDNFNPTLDFGATTGGLQIADDNQINLGASSAKAISIVFTTGTDITTRQLIYEEGGGTHGLNLYILSGQLFSNIWVSSSDNAAGTVVQPNTTYMYTWVYNGSASPTGRWDGYLSGLAVSADATVQNSLPGHTGDIALGVINQTTQYPNNNDVGSGDDFFGKISEIAYYNNNVLSTISRNKMHSYFALKYGISLTQDYISSNGVTKIWNQALNVGYTTGIAGIGRDDFSTLNQKQSKSVKSDGLVTIGIGSVAASNALNPNSFPSDFSSLIWGNNGAGNVFSGANSPVNNQTLNRIWKVQETGSVGSVLLQVPSINSTAIEKMPGISNLNLLVDTDDDFTSGATSIPMTLNGDNWEVNVNFNTGEYFTIAAPGVILTVTTDGDEAGPIDAVFTVTLVNTNNTGSPITFDLTDDLSGTATSGFDYSAIPANTKISVPNGALTGTYSVSIVNDAFIEVTETIRLTISNPSDPGITIGGASAVANIFDNDGGGGAIAPGGVFVDLTFWLKADAGTNTTTNGASVSTWIDTSGNGFDASNDGTSPLFVSVGENYNPALNFANDLTGGLTIANANDINQQSGGFTAKSYTIAFKTNADVTNTQVVYEQGGTVNGLNLYIESGNLITNLFNDNVDYLITTSVLPNFTYVVSYVYDGSNTRTDLYVNGVLAGSNTSTTSNLNAHGGQIGIGKVIGGTQYAGDISAMDEDGFDGCIMEMVYYNEKVYSIAERNRIESYFALKYGVSLDGNYLASDGTIIWNAATHVDFGTNITGLSSDAGSDLFQKQATSSSENQILAIGVNAVQQSNIQNTTTIGLGLDFLIWGNNAAPDTGLADNSSLVASTGEVDRLIKKWKIVEYNNIGTVQMVFNRDSIKSYLPFSSAGNLFLKIADDSSLTTNVTYLVLDSTTSVNGTPSYTTNYDFNGTKYFTVVQKDFIVWSGKEWRGGQSATNANHPSALAIDAAKTMYVFPGDSALAIEPIKINNVVIKNNADLLISATNCFNVGGAFTNNGGFVLQSDVTGFSQYIGPAVRGTFQQYVDDAGWHLIGSPFSDVQFNDFMILNDSGAVGNGLVNHPIDGVSLDSCLYCNMWYYDVSSDNGTDIGFGSSDAFGTWRTSTNGTQLFKPDRGWNIFLDEAFGFYEAPFILQVTGTFNNGTFLDTANENNAGWNLMANPYPSVIDWDIVDDDLATAGIANGYHIWNEENTNYAVYANGTGTLGTNQFIAPFQGFYVQTSAVQPQGGNNIFHDFQLTNADRPSVCTEDNSEFFKRQQVDNVIKLRTTHGSSGKIDETVLQLAPGALRSFKPSEDIHKLFSRYNDAPSLFTKVDGNVQAIGTLPLNGEKDSIRVGCRTNNGSTVTIELVEAPIGYSIYLEDIKTGIWNRIDQNSYTFIQDTRYENRFWLHFAPFALTPNPWQEGKPFYTYIKDGFLHIKTRKSVINATWYLSNASGKVVQTGAINEDDKQEYSTNIQNLAPGAYFFVLTTPDNRYTDKLLKL